MGELLRFVAVRKVYRPAPSLFRFWEKRPEILALSGVDLAVSGGEVVALLGPNGAGKTTTLKLAAGALLPDSGRVDVGSGAVGLVAGGERSFYWRLSAAENLRFYARIFGIGGAAAERRVNDVLARVGLTARAGDAVRTFSGGMRQRLAFARALLVAPALLLVDEFAGELDYPATLDLARFVREDLVRREGRGALVATHQLWLARLLADRVIVLARGRVVADGPPAEVLGTPRGRFGISLPAGAGTTVARLRELVPAVDAATGPGGAYVTFGEPDDPAALAAAFETIAAATSEPVHRFPAAYEVGYLELVGGRDA